MKKKMVKKLSLNRETLVQLNQLELYAAAGGTSYPDPTVTCPERCTYSGRNTCTSCELTCTTNWC